MRILILKTCKEYEVLREKADYYVYKPNGGDEQRIYKKVEGEEFVVVGKEYSWGTVYPQATQTQEKTSSVSSDLKPTPSPFPPVVVKINYEENEELNQRLKKYGHQSLVEED